MSGAELAVSDERALQVLVSSLEIPSVSGEEGAVANHLVAEMQELGYTRAWVDEAGNAVGVMGEGPRQVVLMGHIDTVPGEIPVRREGDLLYGRGAVDAKGPFASFVSAVARVGVKPGWSLVVIGATEEEAPTSKGARYAKDQWAPEACVIGEPSSWDALTLGYKGRLLVEYRLTKGLAHSAGPERSPPEFGVDFWNAIARFAAEANEGKTREFDKVSPSLLEFNCSSDGLHQTIELTVSFRTPLDFDRAAWIEKLSHEAGEARLTFHGGEAAYKGGKSNPLVRAFLAAIRGKGGKPRFKVKTGTADLNVVGPVWQCPILAYGPGDSALDHTPNEHISVTEYAQGVAVLTAALEQLTSE